MVRGQGEPLGHLRSVALPVRDADVLRGIDVVSRTVGMVEMEGKAAQVGPRSHLLAHCRLLLAHNARGTARARLLGMDALRLRVALRPSWEWE